MEMSFLNGERGDIAVSTPIEPFCGRLILGAVAKAFDEDIVIDEFRIYDRHVYFCEAVEMWREDVPALPLRDIKHLKKVGAEINPLNAKDEFAELLASRGLLSFTA